MDTNTDTHSIQAAIDLIGGAIRPTAEALRRLGWPHCGKQAIALRRRAGTLPVAEIRIGREYFVTAHAVTEALLIAPTAQSTQPETDQPVTRRRGRPRKVAAAPQSVFSDIGARQLTQAHDAGTDSNPHGLG